MGGVRADTRIICLKERYACWKGVLARPRRACVESVMRFALMAAVPIQGRGEFCFAGLIWGIAVSVVSSRSSVRYPWFAQTIRSFHNGGQARFRHVNRENYECYISPSHANVFVSSILAKAEALQRRASEYRHLIYVRWRLANIFGGDLFEALHLLFRSNVLHGGSS